ncbi:hypothetical protein G6F66_008720 [Rhizopus arrhizus]|nr:hypothetical protein G6F66_008720 [Rhizopus arrhizus]
MTESNWRPPGHSLFKEPALYGFLSSGNENMFNHYVVWPLMDVSINAIKPKMKLMLVEYILKAFDDEYKADGCILDQFGNEVCLLETSSTFLFKESGKLGYDHVKGTFDALTLFNVIFKKYNNATLEAAQNLTVAFIHARDDSLHLWSLELFSKKNAWRKAIIKLMGEDVQSNLSEMVNTKIEKPVKGAGYGILLPKEKDEDELSIRFIL